MRFRRGYCGNCFNLPKIGLMAGRSFRFLFIVFIVGILMGCGLMDQVSSKSPRESGLDYVSFAPQEPESWKLSNGITVLFLRDDELPFVRGALYLPGGDLWESSDKAGAVGLMGLLLRRGGAGDLSAEKLDEFLEKFSATIASGFGEEFGTVSFNCLRQDFREVFSTFVDVVRRPRFEEDRLSLLKLQKLDGIRRRKDDPDTIASLSLAPLLYGDSSYGRVLNSADIMRIDRAHVVAAYEKFVSPEHAFITIVGDVDRQELEELLERSFGNWELREKLDLTPPAIGESEEGKIVFIEGPFTQATVAVAQLGVPRHTPDEHAIKVFNRIFGMGMGTSRLYQRVRSERGLAYSVYGYISPGLVKGINSIQLQTKAESAGEGLVESVKALTTLWSNPPGESELVERKLAAINSFVFAHESADSTIQRQALFRLYGYPLDYDSHYVDSVRAVSSEDIVKVARTRWSPEKFVIVVVGPRSALKSIEAVIPELEREVGAKTEIVERTFDDHLKWD
jgi:zinc protease